ncbi:MAG: DUF1592 domain-containing protein, partial [Verrucomicrobiae bacterium]|nr:DUF1592 domain-containing protein [Verrucomicrobiae bacterium]
CANLYDALFDWQRTLAASTQDDEEYAVLTTDPFEPKASYPFRVRMNRPPAGEPLEFQILVKAASDDDHAAPAVIWKAPRLRLRSTGSTTSTEIPLREAVTPETAALLQFGTGVASQSIAPEEFVTVGPRELTLRVNLPSDGARVEFLVEPTIDIEHGEDCLVRCEITDGSNARETIASTGSASALIASPASPHVEEWKSGILAFALNLPQVSHREAAPSDRDWIPQPFDNTYNKPERNYFHTAIKYHRDDDFLTRRILDDETALELDRAWTDLLTSFDYYDTIFRFIVKKYNVETEATTLNEINTAWIKRTPESVQEHLYPLFNDYQRKHAMLEKAAPGHVADALTFAEQAWRRPLSRTDRKRLESYYQNLRKERDLDHPEALRTLLVRILVAPEFLYRIENPVGTQEVVALSDWELASRLSYFLWSSKPDDELLQAAQAGELKTDEGLTRQTRRMLQDPRARRFATEF